MYQSESNGLTPVDHHSISSKQYNTAERGLLTADS